MPDSALLINGLIILVFLLVSAFFSAAETSLTAVSRARLFQLVKDGNKRAVIASRLRKKKESLLATVLLGNNAVNIAASSLATAMAFEILPGSERELITLVTLVMTVLIVIFAEILPKTYAIQNAEGVALTLSPPLNLLVRLLTPLNFGINILINWLLSLFGVDIDKTNTFTPPADAIRGTIELQHREGGMVKQERDMLGSILDLDEIEVGDVMVHRKNIDMIDAGLPVAVIIEKAFSMLHSRIPLWKDNPDNIVGILHVKDVVRALNAGHSLDSAALLALAHQPWFVPETTTLRDQLLAFRARRQHFAVVVDEYGALLGIVTLEDIIEEIVGDIDDEHDEREAGDIQKVAPNVYFVAGNVTIRDLNRELDWDLPDEHASTLAGLVMHEARDIPRKGQHLDAHGFRFMVVDKTATQIKRLRVEKLARETAEEDAGI